MAPLACLIVPGFPHHITQRGVRSIDIFADDEDRNTYLHCLAEEAERFGVERNPVAAGMISAPCVRGRGVKTTC